MIRNCPKCGYARKAADTKVPDWQCPSCGVAYAKFLEQAKIDPSAPVASRGTASAPVAAPMSAMALFFILAGLLAAGYSIYRSNAVPSATGGKDSAPQILEVSNPAYFGTLEGGQAVLRMKPESLAQLHRLAPGPVIMFATSWCPYCAKARDVFNKKGVRFTELDLERDGAAEAFQRDVMGLGGFPTIVIGNRVTQGFDEGQIVASLKEL